MGSTVVSKERRLEGDTENVGVSAKKRTGMKSVMIMATPGVYYERLQFIPKRIGMKAKDYQKTERRARLNKALELLVRALIEKHVAFTESVGQTETETETGGKRKRATGQGGMVARELYSKNPTKCVMDLEREKNE